MERLGEVHSTIIPALGRPRPRVMAIRCRSHYALQLASWASTGPMHTLSLLRRHFATEHAGNSTGSSPLLFISLINRLRFISCHGSIFPLSHSLSLSLLLLRFHTSSFPTRPSCGGRCRRTSSLNVTRLHRCRRRILPAHTTDFPNIIMQAPRVRQSAAVATISPPRIELFGIVVTTHEK